MHGPINVKSPNNISKWQMGFNSAFKGLIPCYQQNPPVLMVVAGLEFVDTRAREENRTQGNGGET
jgi:hypothetical protein